jgi:predicted site-specific integrase-resolvase
MYAYARVSTNSDMQSDSLKNQMTYYEKIIRSNPDYEFVEVCADRGITGTTDNRPQLQRMPCFQKTYTIDFLSKKRVHNAGQVPQYYVLKGSYRSLPRQS